MPNVDCFFVVDIGTRFVRGLLCTTKQAEDSLAHDPMKLHVIECEVLEHETRAMLAGQIHDIEKVARIVAHIKDTLEKKLSADKYLKPADGAASPEGEAAEPQPARLTSLAIAVAGRNL